MPKQPLVAPRNMHDTFLYPEYERNCITNLPNAVLNFFGIKNNPSKLPPLDTLGKVDAKKINKVVLLLLDGFGFNQFTRHCQDIPFLADLSSKSMVFPLTSVFPSQTTNALTSLSTGLTPQEHGLFEYLLYMKEADRIVNTPSFRVFDNVDAAQPLLTKEVTPKIPFKGKTVYTTLKAAGIEAFTHAYKYNASCACSKLLFEGSTLVPSLKSSDMVTKLRKNLEKNRGSAYFFVHLDTLDTIAHEYGPESYEFSAELATICYLLKRELIEKIDPQTAEETLILFTADHGEVNITPEETTYLNAYPEITQNLKRQNDGKPILPTGSPRDVFLHVQEDKLGETQDLLTKRIGEKARVMECKQAIKEGLFGVGEAGVEFLERAGNLLVLPLGNETVWFEFFEGRKLDLHGHHGGLTEEEMLVPCCVAQLNKLK
jgi:hypothetical protein